MITQCAGYPFYLMTFADGLTRVGHICGKSITQRGRAMGYFFYFDMYFSATVPVSDVKFVATKVSEPTKST